MWVSSELGLCFFVSWTLPDNESGVHVPLEASEADFAEISLLRIGGCVIEHRGRGTIVRWVYNKWTWPATVRVPRECPRSRVARAAQVRRRERYPGETKKSSELSYMC